MTPENYFYRPLAYFNGQVLKCAGICTEHNQGFCSEEFNKPDASGVYLPGFVIVEGYRRDKIDANNLQPITPFE